MKSIYVECLLNLQSILSFVSKSMKGLRFPTEGSAVTLRAHNPTHQRHSYCPEWGQVGYVGISTRLGPFSPGFSLVGIFALFTQVVVSFPPQEKQIGSCVCFLSAQRRREHRGGGVWGAG